MIRTCTSCGKKNRIPATRLADTGRCGACKASMRPQAEPIDVVDVGEFDGIVSASPVPILVDFWADWCGPCRMAAPHVSRVAAEMSGEALVVKVDTERLPTLAGRYGVRGIPNFVVMRGGKVVQQQAGVVDASTMKRWLQRAAG